MALEVEYMECLNVHALVVGSPAKMADLDLTFDLAVVALTYKILTGLYLGNRKVYEVDILLR